MEKKEFYWLSTVLTLLSTEGERNDEKRKY